MNKSSYRLFLLGLPLLFFFSLINNYSHAQEASLKVTNPFDSLYVTNVSATGNLKTGTLLISMDFHNSYSKLAGVSLNLGGFGNFGTTDQKGKKYKVYNNEHLIGTENINKGYFNISSVQFGDKKLDWVTMLEQDMKSGDSKKFIIRIDKFDKSTLYLNDLHIVTTLFLNYAYDDARLYKVENLKINWK